MKDGGLLIFITYYIKSIIYDFVHYIQKQLVIYRMVYVYTI